MVHDRRCFLRSAVAGSAIFPGIVSQVLAQSQDPLAARSPPRQARAKNVILLFMTGGVSHVGTFDPKPALVRDHGKSIELEHPETKARADYRKL